MLRESGQASAEYVLVTAGVAVACIAVLILVFKPFDGIFSDPSVNIPSGTYTPPVAGGSGDAPTSLADCANQGWRKYHFANQQDCDDFVNKVFPSASGAT
jgi:hypothetical protein